MDSSNKENEQVARPNIVDKLAKLCQDKPKDTEPEVRSHMIRSMRRKMVKKGMRP